MSQGFNQAIMLGNLTEDPSLRYTATGQAVCNLRMAVNTSYKQGDEVKESVFYIDVVVWGKQGEACSQYLKKGSKAQAVGRMETRTWEKDGVKHYKVELVAQKVIFLGGGQGQTQDNDGVEPF